MQLVCLKSQMEVALVPSLLARDAYLHEVLASRLFALFGDVTPVAATVRVFFCASSVNKCSGIEYSMVDADSEQQKHARISISDDLDEIFKNALRSASSGLLLGVPVILNTLDSTPEVAIGVALADHETSIMAIIFAPEIALAASEARLVSSVQKLARSVEHVIADLEFEKSENLLDELSSLSSDFHEVTNLDELLKVASKKLSGMLVSDYAEVRLDFHGNQRKSKTFTTTVAISDSDLILLEKLSEFCKINSTWLLIDDTEDWLLEDSKFSESFPERDFSQLRSVMVVGLECNTSAYGGAFTFASRARYEYSGRMLAQMRRVARQAASTQRRLQVDAKIIANWGFSKELVGKTSLSGLLSHTPRLLMKLSDADEVVLILEASVFTERPESISDLSLFFTTNAAHYSNAVHWRLAMGQLFGVGSELKHEIDISDEIHIPLFESYPLGLLILVKSDGSRFQEDARKGLQGALSHFGATLALISAKQLEYAREVRRKAHDAFYASIAFNLSELVWAIDDRGKIIWVAPNHKGFTGRSDDSILGLDFGNVVRFYTGDNFTAESWFFRTDANIHFEIQDRHGKTHILEAAINELSEPATNGATMIISARDITDKIAMARVLEESESRYRSIVEASGQGMLMLDLDGTIQFANQAMGFLLGVVPSEMTSTHVSQYIDRSSQNIANALFTESLNFVEVQRELILVHRDGSMIHGLTKVSLIHDSVGTPLSRLAVIADISRHKAAEFELEAKLRRDPLTGLLNRNGAEVHFLELLEELEPDVLVAMFFLDLDRFKLINDTKGHLVGDKLLISVAERLNIASRTRDIVARLGGDEFLVIASGFNDAEGAESFGKRIATNFTRPFVVDGEEYHTTASIGIATASSGASWSELLREADTAMYRAKECRSSKVTSFDQSFRSEIERRMHVEGELRQAIARNEISMVFQPIIEIGSGSVVGIESLMRWNSPKLGPVEPNEFIPIAEDSGLILPLGCFAINSSISSYRELVREIPKKEIFVAINVSMRQLEASSRGSFLELIKMVNLGHGRLILEVTESEMMRYTEDFGDLFHELKEMGVQIGIDDFGTGYSSLAQLSALAPDIVKIDKQFIAELESDQARQIVSAVVAMCDALGVCTVAEGVETSQQLEILGDIGCNFAQGFYISKPLDVGQLPLEFEQLEARLSSGILPSLWL